MLLILCVYVRVCVYVCAFVRAHMLTMLHCFFFFQVHPFYREVNVNYDQKKNAERKKKK